MCIASRFKLTAIFSLLLLCVVGFALLNNGRLSVHATGTALKSIVVSASLNGKCKGWIIIPSPNPISQNAVLNGVVALSTSDVWSVGTSFAYGIATQALIEHWNGTSWSIAPSPNLNSNDSYLYGVARVPGTTQLWTVGEYSNNGYAQTLIEHWDGTSWSVVPSPNIASSNNTLNKVVALSANNIWAVGNSYIPVTNGSRLTLIEHWDGTSWSIIASPNPSTSTNYLFGVTSLAANNIWAVGYDYDLSSQQTQTLIEHWDGISWSIVPSPNPGTNPELNGITALSVNNIWAVGTSPFQTVVEHWDGISWSVVPSPSVTRSNVFEDITSTSANNIWAAGISWTQSGSQTLIEHWNGIRWSITSSPNPSSSINDLFGVARVPGSNQLWAVGFYQNTVTNTEQTLFEFHC